MMKILQLDGKAIRVARAEKGWTIKRLSEEAGVTPLTIRLIERNEKQRINITTVEKLARALNKSLDDILESEEYQNESIANI